MSCRKPHSEARILGVSEILLDRETTTVQRDHLASVEVVTTGHEAPGLLHILRVHADNCRYRCLGLRDAYVRVLLGATAWGYPCVSGGRVAVGVGNADGPTETNGEVHLRFQQCRVQRSEEHTSE